MTQSPRVLGSNELPNAFIMRVRIYLDGIIRIDVDRGSPADKRAAAYRAATAAGHPQRGRPQGGPTLQAERAMHCSVADALVTTEDKNVTARTP